MLGAIWAQSADGVIGDGTGMPWHIPEDLAHFKKTTLDHPVIMGRHTWFSLSERFRPLPGRQNLIVSSRAPGEWSAGAEVISLSEVADYSGWIMGGGQLYAATLDQVDRLEVTVIEAELAGLIDDPVYAPAIPAEFERTEVAGPLSSAKGSVEGIAGEVTYRFETYLRKDD